jgi:hypothetical protein
MEKDKKEEKNLFQIKKVGLDTSNLNYQPTISSGEYDLIHVNFSSNNDEFTSSLLEDSAVFMTIEFLDGAKDAVTNYLNHNGLYRLDCLLIDSNCDFERYSGQIKGLIDSKVITESTIGISLPESVERLEEIQKVINFDYISLNICPLFFNAEIIKWAKEHNKKIVGFNPFGGFLSYANIMNSFTIPYLLGFIATYADYVFLSSRDLIYSANEKYYLESLIGNPTEKLYLFTKSMNKLTEPIKKAIKNYLIVDEKTVIEVENPVTGFDKSEIIISTVNIEMEEIPSPEVSVISEDGDEYYNVNVLTPELYVNTAYLNSFNSRKPEGIDDKSYLAILKYNIIELLSTYNSNKYKDKQGSFKIELHKLCDNAIVITTLTRFTERTGIFTVEKKTEDVNFLLYYKNEKFLFRRVLSKD